MSTNAVIAHAALGTPVARASGSSNVRPGSTAWATIMGLALVVGPLREEMERPATAGVLPGPMTHGTGDPVSMH
jgi:hypothetical protein